ncbi:hypothetical protein LTR37_015055 [Vermiconidia calcicola]|uniref:Uncharacterized protein n=1 Tax=Vermiconidia calcicola TaxID=1690605 RepID=A0ACC3MRS9_9PEZI|nr:hypothetical protein LTR37_015055 [Vermiconidia calcicola]
MPNAAFTTTLLAFLTAVSFGATTPTPRACEAPYYRYEDNVPGVYLVNFTDGYTLQQHFDTLGQTFDVTKLNTGYSANLTDDLLSEVRADCGVQFIEEDALGLSPAEDDNNIDDFSQSSGFLDRRAKQKDAPWPLVQLSASRQNPTDDTYYHVEDSGQGVDVYVLDSGINHPQDELTDDNGNDRIIDGFNYSNDLDYTDIGPAPGHGTRVASAIGGKGYGVAKSVTLYNVKFFHNGFPDTLGFVRAMQAIIRKHDARKTQSSFKGSVINMSFSLKKTLSSNKQLDLAYDAGISLVAGAGNYGYGPNHHPSTHPKVISVAGSTNGYIPWEEIGTGSNYGEKQIDLWAPGRRLPLCNRNGKLYPSVGTSFAAGYVSGILAIFY